jgi:hypothetical protein
MFEQFHDVLPDHIRQAALATFPDESWEHWHRYENGKLATKDRSRFPPACQMAIDLIAIRCPPADGFYDPECVGAGLHFMPSGCELGEHQDAAFAGHREWRRTGSLVYFLEGCVGGELIVAGDVIEPVANMAVMFSGSQLHSVNKTHSPRRTLSLFSYVESAAEKTTTRAQFT